MDTFSFDDELIFTHKESLKSKGEQCEYNVYSNALFLGTVVLPTKSNTTNIIFIKDNNEYILCDIKRLTRKDFSKKGLFDIIKTLIIDTIINNKNNY